MNEPEVQAILALCHHNPMSSECPACQFRARAALEHLTVNIQAVVESMGAGTT